MYEWNECGSSKACCQEWFGNVPGRPGGCYKFEPGLAGVQYSLTITPATVAVLRLSAPARA